MFDSLACPLDSMRVCTMCSRLQILLLNCAFCVAVYNRFCIIFLLCLTKSLHLLLLQCILCCSLQQILHILLFHCMFSLAVCNRLCICCYICAFCVAACNVFCIYCCYICAFCVAQYILHLLLLQCAFCVVCSRLCICCCNVHLVLQFAIDWLFY